MSEKDHDFTSLVSIFAQMLPKIKTAAKELGYAVAVHGSMRHDFDLVAVPWTKDAKSAEELVEFVGKTVHGYVIGSVHNPGTLDGPTLQPHGRKTWNICWGGIARIDFSVMPRLEQA